MLNSIYAFAHQTFPVFQENIVRSLSDQHKRIFVVVCGVFGCLAACYAVYSCYNRRVVVKKDEPVKEIKKNEPVKNDEQKQISESEKAFIQAIDLMFHDRRIEFGSWLAPMAEEEKAARHEELKIAIAKIQPEDINKKIYYREGMNSREQTLLLQAVMHIQNPARRFEIVKMLLEKGADPLVQGFYYEPIDLIEEAKKIHDPKLIKLLNNALKEKRMYSIPLRG